MDYNMNKILDFLKPKWLMMNICNEILFRIRHVIIHKDF